MGREQNEQQLLLELEQHAHETFKSDTRLQKKLQRKKVERVQQLLLKQPKQSKQNRDRAMLLSSVTNNMIQLQPSSSSSSSSPLSLSCATIASNIAKEVQTIVTNQLQDYNIQQQQHDQKGETLFEQKVKRLETKVRKLTRQKENVQQQCQFYKEILQQNNIKTHLEKEQEISDWFQYVQSQFPEKERKHNIGIDDKICLISAYSYDHNLDREPMLLRKNKLMELKRKDEEERVVKRNKRKENWRRRNNN